MIGDCPFLGSRGVRTNDETDAMEDSVFVWRLSMMQPDFFQRYGASIVACWESKDKGTEQAKCVTLYLCKAAHLGWIIPNQFGDARSKEMFFGWRGFRVVKEHSDAFKSGLTWVFSLVDGKQCDDSTIQSFFIKANMKPAGTRWKQGFSGEVPFVYVPRATQAVGSALGNIGFESPLHAMMSGDDKGGDGGVQRLVEQGAFEASGVPVAAAGKQTVEGRVGGEAEQSPCFWPEGVSMVTSPSQRRQSAVEIAVGQLEGGGRGGDEALERVLDGGHAGKRPRLTTSSLAAPVPPEPCLGLRTGEIDSPGLSLLEELRKLRGEAVAGRKRTAANSDDFRAEVMAASGGGGRVLWEGDEAAGGFPVPVEYGGGEYGEEEPHPFEAAWWEAA